MVAEIFQFLEKKILRASREKETLVGGSCQRNNTATSALGAGWAVGPSLVGGIFENFARSRKSAPNAHFLKEL